MSSGIEPCDTPDEELRSVSNPHWSAHRSALRTPELRSVLEQLHSRLEAFFTDAQKP